MTAKAKQPKPQKKTGRPLLDIDPEKVEELAAIQCTLVEMAAVFNCDHSTLSKRFSQEIAKGRERGKKSLRRAQWDTALGGNVVMQIWLGKQYLEQSDKVDSTVDATITDKRKKLDLEEIGAFLTQKRKAGINGDHQKVKQNVSRN